jgi:F-type H+-transporting ATPase subunit epsilon
MSFKAIVVTPEAQLLDETVTSVILPAHDGSMGILTDRAPLLVSLGAGPLELTKAGGSQVRYFVDGGVAQMLDNKLTILTDGAIPTQELNREKANAALADAEKLPDATEAEYKKKQKKLEIARAMLRELEM